MLANFEMERRRGFSALDLLGNCDAGTKAKQGKNLKSTSGGGEKRCLHIATQAENRGAVNTNRLNLRTENHSRNSIFLGQRTEPGYRED